MISLVQGSKRIEFPCTCLQITGKLTCQEKIQSMFYFLSVISTVNMVTGNAPAPHTIVSACCNCCNYEGHSLLNALALLAHGKVAEHHGAHEHGQETDEEEMSRGGCVLRLREFA